MIDTTRCPMCKSDQLIEHGVETPIAQAIARAWGNKPVCPLTQCGSCNAFWESWPEGTSHDCVEREPCDNCAYRKGSAESQDPEKWAELVKMASDAARYGIEDERGRRWFSCHKGVPIKITQGKDGQDGGIEFDFKAAGIKPLDQTCAGFLNLVWALSDKTAR